MPHSMIFRSFSAKLKVAFVTSLVVLMIFSSLATAQTERPPTAQLLPENTVLFIEIANIRDMISKMNESAMGKLLQDDAIAPLAQDLWQTGLDAYEEFVDIGLTIEDIQSLPSGEITIAVIAPKLKKPKFLFMIEMDPENEAVGKAIKIGRDFAEKQGAEFESVETDEVTFESIINEGERVTYFQIENLIVASNSQDELDDFLDRWNGREIDKIRPLAENRKFITIMNRCRASKEVPADMRFYVDPIEFARSAFRGEMQAQFVINFLPILGLDGVLAAGGSSTMLEGEYESVAHGHVLLANPRKGILEMLAFKPGDYNPEPWVPEDATTYYSTSLDLRKLMVELEKVVDLVQGEGEFRKGLEGEVNAELGFDIEKDVINSLTGRASMFTWMEPPARFTSQVFSVGVELENLEKAKEVVNLLLEKFEDENEEAFEALEERDYKGQSYWTVSDESIAEIEGRNTDRQRERRESRGQDNIDVTFDVNTPQLCWGFIDNYLLLSGSPDCFELMIDTYRGDKKPLSEEPRFKETAREMTKLMGTDMPSVIIYSQPKETMRAMLDAARLENTGQYFDLAPDNDYVQRIRQAMENNPLPEFETIERYFNPSGMFMTNDDTGFHMVGFQLRAKEDVDKDD